jgi:hypothetical protein
MLRRLLLSLGLVAAAWADVDLTGVPAFNAVPASITAGFSYSLSWTPGDGDVGDKIGRRAVADEE